MIDLRNFVSKIEEMARAARPTQLVTHDHQGQRYYLDADGDPITLGVPNHHPDPVEITTLAGMADLLEHLETPKGTILQVVSPTRVDLLVPHAGATKTNHILARVIANPPAERFMSGSPTAFHWWPLDQFVIALQAGFYPDKELEALTKDVGLIRVEDGVEVSDDGVTPTVTTGRGASLVNRKSLAPIRYLSPMASFPDLYHDGAPDEREPVTVPFLLRVSSEGKLALIPADGGAWRAKVQAQVVDYFTQDRTIPVPVIS